MKNIVLSGIENGWLAGVRRCPSPNCDDRPASCEPSLIVIHNISLPPGEFGGEAIDQLFTNCLDPQEDEFFAEINHLRVASHILIRRCGEIVQYVPFQQRAFHAGVSQFQRRKRCNDFSIGIELEGSDYVAFTEQQYLRLIDLIKVLCLHYPKLTPDLITGHSNIAPGRKTDPGPFFAWERLMAVFQNNLPAPA